MAAMTTVLTERNDLDNKRIYALANHSPNLPQLAEFSRTEAVGSKTVSQTNLIVRVGDVDADGILIPTLNSYSCTVRSSKYRADNVKFLAGWDQFIEMISSDEMRASIISQNYIA